MNDRCNCVMTEIIDGKVYCAYYDIAVRLCTDIPDSDCPEMEDEEEDLDLEDGVYKEDYFND